MLHDLPFHFLAAGLKDQGHYAPKRFTIIFEPPYEIATYDYSLSHYGDGIVNLKSYHFPAYF